MRRYGARRVLRCFIREERKAQIFRLRRVCAQSRERLRILAGCAKTHGTFAFVNFRRREITSAREKRFVYFISPAKLGAMKKASLTLPVSQRANQQNSTTTAWVHVSCAELVRGATTNPFADSVEINPTVFGGTIHFSERRPIEPAKLSLSRNRRKSIRLSVKFVHALLFAKRRMRCDVRVW